MKNWRTLKRLIEEKRDEFDEYIKTQEKENFGKTYEVDIYAYINDDETEVTFDEFINIGGNSWLDDDHFTIYRFKPSYQSLEDEFESEKEYVDYMVECYNVVIPFDEFTDDDGDIDYIDCIKFIKENFGDEYDKAVSDLIDESWDGTITDYIMDDIRAKAREEEEEEE